MSNGNGITRSSTYENLGIIKNNERLGEPLDKKLQGQQSSVFKAQRKSENNIEQIIYKEVDINNESDCKAAYREILSESVINGCLEEDHENNQLLNRLLIIDDHEVSRGQKNGGNFGTGDVCLVMTSEKQLGTVENIDLPESEKMQLRREALSQQRSLEKYGFIHGDFHDGNIFVSKENDSYSARLGDFEVKDGSIAYNKFVEAYNEHRTHIEEFGSWEEKEFFLKFSFDDILIKA